MTAVIFDSETTGTEPAMMIEGAGIVLMGEEKIDLRVRDRFEQRYNPGVPSTLAALATHNILDSELEGMPHPGTFTLPSGTTHLIGHNVDYDWVVIDAPPVKRICTLALARYIWPDLDCHKLGALVYHIKGRTAEAREMLKGAHGAQSDCESTRWLLYMIVSRLKQMQQGVSVDSWDSLWIISEQARVPKHMPFGKHKGTAMADLPPDYVDWLRRQPDLDQYMKLALSTL